MPTISAEDLRVAALNRCGILDTPPDVHYDCITRLAAQFFDAPMAAISFVTRDRSWFKSTYGFSQSQLARSASFCSHTLGCPEGLAIPDATADERFAGLALVAGHPKVRFYAGAPVVCAEGFAVGAVAIMDTRPRGPFSETDIGSLRDFSALVGRELNSGPSAGDGWSILSAIIQSAEDAIIGTDLNGIILTWNPGAERLYGYSATEVLGRPINVIIPSDRLEEARDLFKEARQGRPTMRRETVRLHKDGTRRFVSLSKAAVRDRYGKPVGVAAIAHDITALTHTECTRLTGEPVRAIGINLDVTNLREAERARRELEEQYTHLFHTMSESVMVLDGEGFVLSLNPAAEKLWGLPIEEACGHRRSELHWRITREDGAPLSADEFPSMVALRTGSAVHDVVVRMWNRRTEEPHWVSIDAIPRVRADETKPCQIHVITRDITAQVEAEARLRASEERWRLLIEHGMEVIVVMDSAATVRFVSPSVERVFGYPPDLLMGTNVMDYVHPDDRPLVQGSLMTMLQSPGAAETLHFRVHHRDGSWRSVEAVAANCLHVKGLHGIVTNVRDIGESVQYQEQLRQLAARVESAREEERARISREVHDEFGQMLSVLKLDLEGLAFQHRPRGAEARGKFDTRIAAMVRAIDLSANTVRRIAAALRPAVFEDLGLAAALEWQIQEFQARTGIRCRRRGLQQDADLAVEPSLAVFRIFQEILTNVVRHAKATTLQVAIDADPDWFTLRVSDNGTGFDLKLLPVSRSLGILGMRERAGIHGGTVEWSARRGGGTTVTVRLPQGERRISLFKPDSDL